MTRAFRHKNERIMADGPRCKRRKQANPRRNNGEWPGRGEGGAAGRSQGAGHAWYPGRAGLGAGAVCTVMLPAAASSLDR